MQKPAREATLFALLGLLVASGGIVAKLEADARMVARTRAAEAVHAADYQLPGMERSNAMVVVTLENGTILHIRRCPNFDPRTAYESVDRMTAALETRARRQKAASQANENARPRNDARLLEGEETLDCRNFSFASADRALLERDYWAAYRESKQEEFARSLRGSLVMGLFGLPAGLGVWILYRRVRLGVRG